MNNETTIENGLKQAFNEEDYSLIVRYLRNIAFKIEDYIRDSDKVLNKAVGMIPREHVNVGAVRCFLHFLFLKQVEAAVRWDSFPWPVLFGDILSLVYEGQTYRAVVRSRKKEMEVILEDTVHPIKRVVTIPDGIDATFTDDLNESCSDYGIQRAKEVILSLVLEKRYLLKS